MSELDSVAQLNKNPRREAGFKVLRAHDVPSVLLELGYLSSRKDLDMLVSEEWRGKAVASIAVAIERFFPRVCATRGRRSFTIETVWISVAGMRFLG